MRRGLGKACSKEVVTLLEDAANQGRALTLCDQNQIRIFRRRVEAGDLVEPYKNTFMARADWKHLDFRQRVLYVLRALTQIHNDWIFCNLTAGVVHGLELGLYSTEDCESIFAELHILSSLKSHSRSSKGVVRHRSERTEFDVIDGIAVTPYWDTVFDCMRDAGFGRSLAIADHALKITGLAQDQMIAKLSEVGYQRQGMARVRKTARLANALSENGGESIVRAYVYYLGFAVPQLQVVFIDPLDPSRTFRVDFLWITPDGKIIVGELDGGAKYQDLAMTQGATPLQIILKERRREARLTVTVDKVIRLSFEEACNLEYLEWVLEKYGIPREEHDIRGLMP